ncbi:radical SAM protein [Candidatus Sumerlaeota bacterium]|nr:radical SAM protein [Candidatus Sumerlaeota bacterium]
MSATGLVQRAVRHTRLSLRARNADSPPTPPFLILFINSICNLTCEHCFYWRNLNRRDDLTFDEMKALSEELGPIENLNLSGGEPFIREDFAAIVRLFIQNNGVKMIYVPTNGYYTDKTEKAIRDVLLEPGLQMFTCEFSIDGMPEYHNRFRGNPRSFDKIMETYERMASLQKEDPRVRIHAISTVTNENVEEVRKLSEFLYTRCPAMEHHSLAMIRGDRKNEGLRGAALEAYRALWEDTNRLWAPREESRFGAIVEPMLQWTKMQTAERQCQIAPCRAGILTGVVYANGDVSLCETHAPIGNLRQKSFLEIWGSPEARELRQKIAAKACWCTNEMFMWPSVTYDPASFLKAAHGAGVWKRLL